MEESQNPTLKLIIDKGPRKGETLEARPDSSSIRIGRVIRGNTFTIKDPAISQKHIEIAFVDGKWTVTDLDTSNGTFINDVMLKSLSPSTLDSGDVIKMGESTSITVTIDGRSDPGPDAPEKHKRRGRRAPLRKGRAVSEDELVRLESVSAASVTTEVGESSDLEHVPAKIGLQRNPRRQAAPIMRKAVPKDDPVPVETVYQKLEKSNLESDTSFTMKVEENSVLENGPVMNGLRRNPRRRAAPTKNTIALKDNVVPLESVLLEKVPESLDLGLDTIKSCETTSIPVQIEGTNDVENAQVESRSHRNPRQGNALNRAGVSSKDEEGPSESFKVQEVAETSGLRAENNVATKENSAAPMELEKITLGEWFDRMEIYLPKQINDAAEEMIQSLRQRHEQFVEFIEQQRDEKGKLPVVN